MRRIILWLTATLAVAALVVSFQLNRSGTSGKDEHPVAPVACATAPAGTACGAPGAATPGGTDDGSDNGTDAGKGAEHPGHEGKPGENK